MDWYLSRTFIKNFGETGVRNSKVKANFVYLTIQIKL